MLSWKNTRTLAVATLLGAAVSAVAAPATASSPALRARAVPCGDVAELIEQVNEANARGRGSILLSSGCTYALTAPALPDGANGLPTITGNVALTGSRVTITRQSPTPFRIAEVAPQGELTLNGITVSGGSATGNSATVGGGILTEGGSPWSRAGSPATLLPSSAEGSRSRPVRRHVSTAPPCPATVPVTVEAFMWVGPRSWT